MAAISVEDLTPSVQNYLKAIWTLQEWTDDPVMASAIAERVGLRTSTVSGALAKLTESDLVVHNPYGAVELTALGRSLALAMVRRHRLIETFLVRMLDYTWDQVDDEAERLEHAVSDFMVDRIDEVLGRPDRDPHGDPIPSANLALTQPAALTLTVLPEGATGTVARISDDDPDVLRYFADLGFGLDAHVRIHARRDAIGVIDVLWAPTNNPNHLTELTLGLRAADAVWIETE